MLHCPDCDVPVEYDEDSGKYYCPRCHQYWESSEVERKKTIDDIYQEH